MCIRDRVRRVSFYATEFRTFTGAGTNGLQVGMIVPMGRNRSVSASGASDGSRQVQVQQTASQVGDWGYQAYVAGGNSNHEFVQGQYKAPLGLFTAGVDRNYGMTTLRVESQGAISFADKALFASNEIYDSFAVVDTRPLENIRVYQENRYAGTTGSSGRVLVPDLRAFELNHLSIEPTDVPADVALISDKRALRPQDRSGVVVKFPIHIDVYKRQFLLNAGTATGATVTNRSMVNGAVLLGYGLYSDAAHTANFGATATAVNGTGSAVVTTVYGQVPAGQYVAPNTYTDTITATVSY